MTGSHPGMGGTQSTKPAAAPAPPAFSPFEQDKNRRRPEGSASAVSAPTPIAVAPRPIAAASTPIAETRGATAISLAAAAELTPAPRPAIELAPTPAPARVPEPTPQPVAPQPIGLAPEPTVQAATSAATPAADAAQRAVVEALNAANQSSAADAMEDAAWTITNDEARVQTELSKMMLPVVMNQEAEKIARAALREAGVLKLTLLTGTANHGAAKKARPARSGSVEAKALAHPLVQQAQKLFAAEIQTVFDLRESD